MKSKLRHLERYFPFLVTIPDKLGFSDHIGRSVVTVVFVVGAVFVHVVVTIVGVQSHFRAKPNFCYVRLS